MEVDAERQDTRKAVAFDLIYILEHQEQKTFSVDEMKKLITDYVITANQK